MVVGSGDQLAHRPSIEACHRVSACPDSHVLTELFGPPRCFLRGGSLEEDAALLPERMQHVRSHKRDVPLGRDCHGRQIVERGLKLELHYLGASEEEVEVGQLLHHCYDVPALGDAGDVVDLQDVRRRQRENCAAVGQGLPTGREQVVIAGWCGPHRDFRQVDVGECVQVHDSGRPGWQGQIAGPDDVGPDAVGSGQRPHPLSRIVGRRQ